MSTDEQSPQESSAPESSAQPEPAADAAAVVPAVDAPRHALLLYTLARLGLLVVAGAVLYVAGARSWFLLVLAFLLSGLLSFILLGRLRDAVSAKVSGRIDATRQRRAAAASAEDDLY